MVTASVANHRPANVRVMDSSTSRFTYTCRARSFAPDLAIRAHTCVHTSSNMVFALVWYSPLNPMFRRSELSRSICRVLTAALSSNSANMGYRPAVLVRYTHMHRVYSSEVVCRGKEPGMRRRSPLSKRAQPLPCAQLSR